MQVFSTTPVPFMKGDKLGTFQSSRNQLEINEMKSIPYASAVGIIMYAQIYTCPDLAFVTGLLGRFQSNPRIKHWKAAKKPCVICKRLKDYMIRYKKTNKLKVIGYSDSDFVGCADSQKSTLGYVFTLTNVAIS
jgi:hypothetical protein